MAMKHVSEDELTLDWEPANGTIYPGDLVVRESGGGVHPFDPSNDSRIDGIVPLVKKGDVLPEQLDGITEFKDVDKGYKVYELTGDGTVDGSDSVPVQPLAMSTVIMPFTAEDESLPEPTFSRNDVMVAVNINGSNGGSGRPRIVEDGYTADPDGDGTDTTFSESNGNAVALGRVNQFQRGFKDNYMETLEVRLDPDLLG